jgi:hypothetical protein
MIQKSNDMNEGKINNGNSISMNFLLLSKQPGPMDLFTDRSD